MNPPTGDSAAILAQLDRRVERLANDRPDLASALRLQSCLIRETLSAATGPDAPALNLSHQRGLAKLREGMPLLHEEVVHVDVAYAGHLFGRLVNLLSATASQQPGEPDTGKEPLALRIDALVGAASQGRLDPYALFREAFVQHRQHLVEIAVAAQIDADLLVVLAGLAVTPLLEAYARPFWTEHLDAERLDADSPAGTRWNKGYCPVCGAWPALGELRGMELQRHLRCGACWTSWPSRRLTCVYCDNQEFRELERLQVEGERRLGLDVCRRCHGYLKVLNSFTPTPGPLLSLEDLASAHLDVAAVERGFFRPMTQGYQLEIAAEAVATSSGVPV